jgi:hypothetical protein
MALLGRAVAEDDPPLLISSEPIQCIKDYNEYSKYDFCLARFSPVSDAND